MKEHEKRFRIEFTVNVHNEGVTKEWDWSNDDIKEMALQELDCMSPWPFDITFSEVDSNWYTGTPIEEGWYVLECSNGIEDYHMNKLENKDGNLDWRFHFIGKIIRWQKIELYRGQ